MPSDDKSQQLLDGVNRLAEATENLTETLPQCIEMLEGVSQQFAILIALEAERRSTTPQQLVKDTLTGLMDRAFGSGKKSRF